MFLDNVEKIIVSDEYDDLRKLQLTILEIMKVMDDICKKHSLKYWIDAGTLLGAVRHGGFIPWDDDCDICMPREDYEKFDRIIREELPEGLVYENKHTKDWKQVDVDIQPSFGKIYYLGCFKGRERASNLRCIGTFIDIFPFDYVNEELVISKTSRFVNRMSYFRKSKPKKLRDFLKIGIQKMEIENSWINKSKRLYKSGGATHMVYGVDTPFMDVKYMQEIDVIFPLKEIEFEGVKFLSPNDSHRYLEKAYGDYMKLPPEEERIPHIIDLEI